VLLPAWSGFTARLVRLLVFGSVLSNSILTGKDYGYVSKHTSRSVHT